MNCPTLPRGDPRSHSLLLERGLFRIALPWPPRRPDGTTIEPEFTIEVVRDPSGCNTGPGPRAEQAESLGLGLPAAPPGRQHEVHDASELRGGSVRRQERHADRDGSRHGQAHEHESDGRRASADAGDPGAGRRDAAPADRRYAQRRADRAHRRVRVAGVRGAGHEHRRGDAGRPDGPPAFGPRNLAAGEAGVLGNNTTRYVFPMATRGLELPRTGNAAARTSGRRGARVDRARARRVHVPDVLDPRLDAPEHRRPRQSGQTHLRHLPRDAHDRHGHGLRLDGHRHDEPAMGLGGAAESRGPSTRRRCRSSGSPAIPA
jgi:hypothetical protein